MPCDVEVETGIAAGHADVGPCQPREQYKLNTPCSPRVVPQI
jgi:hypothetical protein